LGITWKARERAVRGGEGNAPPGDGDEGSEGIVHWRLLILV
jgi:hypothetical protein